MSDPSALIDAAARAITALAPAVPELDGDVPEIADARSAAARGYFTPDEDERIHAWFARYLTVRAGLLETIDDLAPIADPDTEGIDEVTRLRGFVASYAAACLLVRAGRFLVSRFATHTLIQRKLNEAEPRFRIPRKQYTRVYRALTSPVNAWRLNEAMEFADSRRADIDALASDPALAGVVAWLREAEPALRMGVRDYFRARLRYRWYSWRRRRSSAAQQAMFGVLEAFGRVIAEMRPPWEAPRVGADVREALAALVEPGDVLVTRHDHALSNLFLPGYWPHAALHIGTASQRVALGVEIDAERASRWVDPLRVLEARKDGVLFRSLDDTLAVDAVALIRPRLAPADLARALARAVTHEGKGYNFDFDFFRADRLVCTEVVYRAYDGVGDLSIELKPRAGRLTLSAEDLLDLAVDGRGFEPVAMYGAPTCARALVTGDEAARALWESYRGG